MIKKYFLINVFIVVVANILVKPIWIFAIDRNVQIQVGHQNYGWYTALLGLTVVFNILLDLGVTNYANRELASDRNRIHSLLPNLLVIKILLAVGYMILVSLFAWVLGYRGSLWQLALVLGVSQVLSSVILYFRSIVSANHDFKVDALLSVLDKVCMIVLCGYFLFIEHYMNMKLFVLLQIISYAVTVTVALVFIRFKYSKFSWGSVAYSEILPLLKSCLPYACLIFLMGIFMRADAIILERMAGAKQTGIFANSFRILDMCNTVGVLFAGVLLSMFARILSQQGSVNGLLLFSSRVLLPFGFAVAIVSSMWAPQWMLWIYHDSSEEVARVFAVTMLSFPAYCILYVYSTLLTANNSIWLLVRIALLGAVLSLVLNGILVYHYQALGTAIACAVVIWLLAFLYMYETKKRFQLPVDVSAILKYLAFLAALIGMNMALRSHNLSVWGIMGVNAAATLMLYVLLGFIGRKAMLAYVRQYIS
jgi:O-antigen/teichoic acid export membrane protein